MRSGLTTGLAAIALSFALTGCDQIKQMTGMDQSGGSNTSTASTNGAAPSLSGPGASSGAPGKPATSDPALAAEMSTAAAQISTSLPIQVDQITRVVAVRAEGTEFVYDLTISQAVPPAQIETIRETMQRTNQANMCGNPNVATFIRRGGSMNHRYVDSAGNRFETRVVSCS
ncbi:MAG TPA: hypothetical protein VLK25_10860 [Allosphingosinicella sp.]|nr:hypothetical protein [Allosphingosinicella sp.]